MAIIAGLFIVLAVVFGAKAYVKSGLVWEASDMTLFRVMAHFASKVDSEVTKLIRFMATLDEKTILEKFRSLFFQNTIACCLVLSIFFATILIYVYFQISYLTKEPEALENKENDGVVFVEKKLSQVEYNALRSKKTREALNSLLRSEEWEKHLKEKGKTEAAFNWQKRERENNKSK